VERNVIPGLVIAATVFVGLLAGGAELMTFIVVFSVLGIVALTVLAVRRTMELNAEIGAMRPQEPLVVSELETVPPARPSSRPAARKPPPPVLVTEPAPPGSVVGPTPRADGAAVAAPQPPPQSPAPPPPAATKGDVRARIAEVKAAIDARPGGVPRELALFDSWTIAERVVKGRTRTAPDGTPLVEVMGEWYVSTPGDPGRFLQRWRE